MEASGQGLVESRDTLVPYVAAGARIAVAVPLTQQILIAAYGDLATPLTHMAVIVSSQTVWEAPNLLGSFGLSVDLAFP